MPIGAVCNPLPGSATYMSEGERLRELAAHYSRMANLTSKHDVRNWLMTLAADTLERARTFERKEMTHPNTDSADQQPAQQQQHQPQPKEDDLKKE
jgi:hypothetical protein